MVAVMIAAGCGGSDGSSTETPNGSEASAGTSGPDETSSAGSLPDFGYEGGNFIKVFEDNDLFSDFLKAIDAAGLTSLFESEPALTVFVPANKAFEELPDGVLDKLLDPKNKQVLADILRYHIIEGSYRAPDIQKGNVKTLQGSDVTLEAFDTADFTKLLMVNGKYAIIPNMEATNGWIHVINWIMIPPDVDLDSL